MTTIKTNTALYIETSVIIYPPTWCDMPQALNLDQHRCQKRKSWLLELIPVWPGLQFVWNTLSRNGGSQSSGIWRCVAWQPTLNTWKWGRHVSFVSWRTCSRHSVTSYKTRILDDLAKTSKPLKLCLWMIIRKMLLPCRAGRRNYNEWGLRIFDRSKTDSKNYMTQLVVGLWRYVIQ